MVHKKLFVEIAANRRTCLLRVKDYNEVACVVSQALCDVFVHLHTLSDAFTQVKVLGQVLERRLFSATPVAFGLKTVELFSLGVT